MVAVNTLIMNTDENIINYSVVIPVYNSQDTLVPLIGQTREVFLSQNLTFEIILVDDYSTDKSWEVIGKLKKEYENEIIGIKLSKNYGQHNAVFCGIVHSSGEFVITIDDDLQTPPQEIIKLIERQKETKSDVVYGIYQDKKHSWFRNWGSKTIQRLSKWLFKYAGKGSSFRIFTKQIAQNISIHKHPFTYIDEIFHWYTDNINFVNVEHQKRLHNKSGYSNWRLIKLFANILFYYTAFPLKIMTIFGFIFSIITLLVGIRYIVQKIFFNVPLGYTSLIVAILFSTSVVMMCLGIIGEYLSRIYLFQNKKPPYSISQIAE